MEVSPAGQYRVFVERTYQPEGIAITVAERRQLAQTFVAQYPGFTTAAQRQSFRDALIAMAVFARDNPLP